MKSLSEHFKKESRIYDKAMIKEIKSKENIEELFEMKSDKYDDIATMKMNILYLQSECKGATNFKYIERLINRKYLIEDYSLNISLISKFSSEILETKSIEELLEAYNLAVFFKASGLEKNILQECWDSIHIRLVLLFNDDMKSDDPTKLMYLLENYRSLLNTIRKELMIQGKNLRIIFKRCYEEIEKLIDKYVNPSTGDDVITTFKKLIKDYEKDWKNNSINCERIKSIILKLLPDEKPMLKCLKTGKTIKFDSQKIYLSLSFSTHKIHYFEANADNSLKLVQSFIYEPNAEAEHPQKTIDRFGITNYLQPYEIYEENTAMQFMVVCEFSDNNLFKIIKKNSESISVDTLIDSLVRIFHDYSSQKTVISNIGLMDFFLVGQDIKYIPKFHQSLTLEKYNNEGDPCMLNLFKLVPEIESNQEYWNDEEKLSKAYCYIIGVIAYLFYFRGHPIDRLIEYLEYYKLKKDKDILNSFESLKGRHLLDLEILSRKNLKYWVQVKETESNSYS